MKFERLSSCRKSIFRELPYTVARRPAESYVTPLIEAEVDRTTALVQQQTGLAARMIDRRSISISKRGIAAWSPGEINGPGGLARSETGNYCVETARTGIDELDAACHGLAAIHTGMNVRKLRSSIFPGGTSMSKPGN